MSEEEKMLSEEARAAHGRALMLKRRCPHCAEPVHNNVLMRGAPCPQCKRQAQWSMRPDAEGIITGIEARWRRTRLVLYGVLAAVALVVSFVPVVGSVALLVAQVAAWLLVVKDTTRWFGPARRMTTRFVLKLWMVVVGLFGIAALEALTLAAGFNLVLKPVLSVASLLIFVETSLWFVRGRLRQEADGAPLRWWEWALPAGLVATVIGAGTIAALSLFALVSAAQHAFQWANGLF
ncbi:MAG: hypothetical protein AAFX99_15880 [Myxococcota bacterium]